MKLLLKSPPNPPPKSPPNPPPKSPSRSPPKTAQSGRSSSSCSPCEDRVSSIWEKSSKATSTPDSASKLRVNSSPAVTCPSIMETLPILILANCAAFCWKPKEGATGAVKETPKLKSKVLKLPKSSLTMISSELRPTAKSNGRSKAPNSNGSSNAPNSNCKRPYRITSPVWRLKRLPLSGVNRS